MRADHNLMLDAACEVFTDGKVHADTLKRIMRMPSAQRAALLTGVFGMQDSMRAEFISLRERSEWDKTAHSLQKDYAKVSHRILIGSPHRKQEERGRFKSQLGGMVRPPQYLISVMEPCGEEIDNAKQACAEKAVRENFDYLVLLDDDVYPYHPHWLTMLLEHKRLVVAGNYIIKRMPENSCSHRLCEDGKREPLAKTFTEPLVPASHVAGGLLLIHTDVFKGMPKPWFKAGKNANGDYLYTEDMYFSAKCKDHKVEMWIDTRVWGGHYEDSTGIWW